MRKFTRQAALLMLSLTMVMTSSMWGFVFADDAEPGKGGAQATAAEPAAAPEGENAESTGSENATGGETSAPAEEPKNWEPIVKKRSAGYYSAGIIALTFDKKIKVNSDAAGKIFLKMNDGSYKVIPKGTELRADGNNLWIYLANYCNGDVEKTLKIEKGALSTVDGEEMSKDVETSLFDDSGVITSVTPSEKEISAEANTVSITLQTKSLQKYISYSDLTLKAYPNGKDAGAIEGTRTPRTARYVFEIPKNRTDKSISWVIKGEGEDAPLRPIEEGFAITQAAGTGNDEAELGTKVSLKGIEVVFDDGKPVDNVSFVFDHKGHDTEAKTKCVAKDGRISGVQLKAGIKYALSIDEDDEDHFADYEILDTNTTTGELLLGAIYQDEFPFLYGKDGNLQTDRPVKKIVLHDTTKPEVTGIEYNKKSFDADGGEVVVTINGKNLDKENTFEAELVKLAPSGQAMTSDITLQSKVVNGTRSTITFTLPKNSTTKAERYQFRYRKSKNPVDFFWDLASPHHSHNILTVAGRAEPEEPTNQPVKVKDIDVVDGKEKPINEAIELTITDMATQKATSHALQASKLSGLTMVPNQEYRIMLGDEFYDEWELEGGIISVGVNKEGTMLYFDKEKKALSDRPVTKLVIKNLNEPPTPDPGTTPKMVTVGDVQLQYPDGAPVADGITFSMANKAAPLSKFTHYNTSDGGKLKGMSMMTFQEHKLTILNGKPYYNKLHFVDAQWMDGEISLYATGEGKAPFLWKSKTPLTQDGKSAEVIIVKSVDQHKVTVADGTTDHKEAGAHDVVRVTAADKPNAEFTGWTADDESVKFANPKEKETTFSMIDKDVKVTANYKKLTHSITVENGTADPQEAAEGATVTITAGAAPDGYKFKNWTVNEGDVELKDANKATTTFTMKGKAVKVTANYEKRHAPGWDLIDGSYYYYDKDGEMVKNDWVKGATGLEYYLKADGKMAVDEVVPGGRYVDPTGAWDDPSRSSWKRDGNGWWYVFASGKYPTNRFHTIAGVRYHFNAAGYMNTGWFKDGGEDYYAEPSGAVATSKWVSHDGLWYYLKADGKMAKNETTPDNYYVDATGAWLDPAKGTWRQDAKGWWFQSASGSYAKNVFLTIKHADYHFNEEGYMDHGTFLVDGTKYQTNSDGAIIKKEPVEVPKP